MASTVFFQLRSIFRPFYLGVFTLVIWLSACQSDNKSFNLDTALQTSEKSKSDIKYAVGFDLEKFEKYKVLHLFRHYNNTTDTLSYVLLENGAHVDKRFQQLVKINVPIQNIALLHSSYLPFFELCETTDLVTAISESKYIYNEKIFNKIATGALPEVGYGESLDKEQILKLGINTVVTVGWPNTPNKSQQLLMELEIPVLVFSEWQESTLLGRAEWIKVIAALTGADELANVKFYEIEEEYNRLKAKASNVSSRPKIVCNLPYKGSWYVPGGNSYMSNVLSDAGGDYLWSDDPGTGGIQMDFELVYSNGINADIWINPGTAKSTNNIIETDERLKDFLPVRNNSVFNYTKRVVRGIANDYWESAITQPQLVLADYIKILHPELLPDHELYYYQQLK